MIVSIIAAMTVQDRAIGKSGRLPWHLPADLKRFKQLTMGRSLILGRLTFESLHGRPLPGRRIIAVSSSLTPSDHEHLEAAFPTLQEALDYARVKIGEAQAFLGGGSAIFSESLAQGWVNRMYLTLVETSVEADTFFPAYDPAEWHVESSEKIPADETNAHPMTFLDLRKY